MLTNEDVGALQRILAEALVSATTEAAHATGVAATNDIIRAANMLGTQEGVDQLHVLATAEAKRVDGLLFLIKDFDRMLLSMCSEINSLVQKADEDTAEKLVILRQTLLNNEEMIRSVIEHTERERGA